MKQKKTAGRAHRGTRAASPPSKRMFVVDFEGSVTIELDERVIAAVHDEWRAQMYSLYTPEEIAEHIAYNMVKNGLRLESIDGWADQPNDRARIVDEPGWDMNATEITEEPPKRRGKVSGRKKTKRQP